MRKKGYIHKPKKRFKPNANTYWSVQRSKLKCIFLERGITTCEIGLKDCMYDNMLSFAHLHKRIWYKDPERTPLLGHPDQVLLACIPCHQKIEDSRELTEKYFLLRRGKI